MIRLPEEIRVSKESPYKQHTAIMNDIKNHNWPANPNDGAEGSTSNEIKALSNKSWDELDKMDKLEMLKEKSPEVFKAKYKERFKVQYDGNPVVSSNQDTKSYMNPSLVNSSWDELDKMGKLEQLKEEAPGVFRNKYRNRFGKEYQEN